MSTMNANKFCSACGNALIETAVICPKCGSPTAIYRPNSNSRGKSKTTAVVLAVFLGIWSWLYTYRVNKTKFWLTISLHLLWWGLLVLWAWMMTIRSANGYYPSADSFEVLYARILGWVGILGLFGFWIWALIDNVKNSEQFYRDYR
jgi:predicted RNA-binding Zn-ribbon protein involved in translation (DUF1610 family)